MSNEEMTRRMEEANALAQQQHHQQQLLLQHHQQQQKHQQFLLMQQQFQHQQPLTRFSSNSTISTNDSHSMPQQPRNPLHHNHLLQQQPQQQHKGNIRQGFQTELEMAQQDAWKICNPDIKRPFSSLEDACERIFPYHVVADYEAEEDDRILDSDTTGQLLSRSQVWDQNLVSKVGEYTGIFEKQIHIFNALSKRRALGDLRLEERLMIEQSIFQDERQKLIDTQAEIEAREKAGREAAEAKMRIAMAQAEQARAEAQAHAEVLARAEAAARVEASRVEALVKARAEEHTVQEPTVQEQGVNMDEILHGWGTLQREDDAEPSEDFLNDDHDPETGDDRGFQNMEVASGNGIHDDWREVGELDLNMR